jgi:hypothetical protein
LPIRIVVLSFVFSLLISCDQVPQARPVATRPTAGEQVFDLLQINTKSEPCTQEKAQFLKERKAAFVESVNLLFADFPSLLPDQGMAEHTLQQLKNEKIKGIADNLAWILRSHATELSNNLEPFSGIDFFPFVDEEKVWEVIQFFQDDMNKHLMRDILEQLSDSRVHGAISRFQRFAFTHNGQLVLNYAKAFINEPETREFMFLLFDFAKEHHGGFLENRELELCLGEAMLPWGQPGRSFCVSFMSLWGHLDPDLSREALDYGALVYQQKDLFADLLFLEKTFKELYERNKGAFENKMPPYSREDIRVFFGKAEHARIAKLFFELFFESDVLYAFAEHLQGLSTQAIEDLNLAKKQDYDLEPLFDFVDTIRREDLKAASQLLKMGFEFWSMNEGNACQVRLMMPSPLQGIDKHLLRFADFLTDPKDGLKSWLSLSRRVAQDHGI